jgi:hypothetical protein
MPPPAPPPPPAHSPDTLPIAAPGPNSTTSNTGRSPIKNIKNRCGFDGVVPHSYIVTLKPPRPSNRPSAPTSAGLNSRRPDISFLKGWFQRYKPDKPGPPIPNPPRAVHYFLQTQLAVAIEAGDDVRHAQHAPKSSIRPAASRLCSRSHTPHQVAMRMTNDPDVFSVERDCYSQLNASSLPKFKGVVRDSSPDLHKVARRLSVQGDAPWGLDRIDTAGEPAVRSWRQQHHHRAAMALASRTAAPACNSAPE